LAVFANVRGAVEIEAKKEFNSMLVIKKIFARVLSILMVFHLAFTPNFVSAEGPVVIIDDPTPDTTAPALKDIQIAPVKPELLVSPNNAVKISAEVSDDLSGVDKVRVEYKKPSGTTTSINLSFQQSSSKYVGLLPIDIYDEPGIWVLNSVYLEDVKDNFTYILNLNNSGSYEKRDFSLQSFEVTGVTEKPVIPPKVDFVAPVLNSIEISTQSVTSGGKIKITASASDVGEGVSFISVKYKKPSGRSMYSTLSLNQENGLFEGSMTIDQFEELGKWILDYVQVVDKASNSKSIYNSTEYKSNNSLEKMDFSNQSFEVTGTKPDLIGPTLSTLSISVLQRNNNTAVVKLIAEANDALSGVSSMSLSYLKPNGKNIDSTFSLNRVTGKYEASIPIDKYDLLETYRLKQVYLADQKNNSTYIRDISSSNSSNGEVINLRNFDFTVKGAITVSPGVPFSISLTPEKMTMEPGQSQQLNSILNFTDSTKKDVTLGSSGTTYTSSNPTAVKVDENGMITVLPGASPGLVFVQAANSGFYQQIEITVPVVTTPRDILKVNPFDLKLTPGSSKQLKVIAMMANGTNLDVTSGETGTQYVSADPEMATVNQNGVISIPQDASYGTVKISINYNGIIGEAVVSINKPSTLSKLVMTPDGSTLPKGKEVQLSVRAIMSDGTTKDITSSTSGTKYKSYDERIAKVDEEGLVRISPNAPEGFQVKIQAINSEKTTEVTIFVLGKEVIDLWAPEKLVVAPGKQEQLSIKYGNKDVTSSASGITYQISETNYASTSAINTQPISVNKDGLITVPTTIPTGSSATITVTYGELSKMVIVMVGRIKKLEASTRYVALKPGNQAQITLTATYLDNTKVDVTSSAYWSSNLINFVQIQNGRATALDFGKGMVSASFGGKTVQIQMDTTLRKVFLQQKNVYLKPNQSVSLNAFAVFADGSQEEITEDATWSGNNPASISVEQGQVAFRTFGIAQVTVEYKGKKATVSVNSTIKQLILDQKTIKMKPGSSVQVRAKAVYWDNSQEDVTKLAKWTSSNPNLFQIEAGEIRALGSGKAQIRVTVGGKTAVISSVDSSVSKLVSDNLKLTLKPGQSIDIPLLATYVDGTSENVVSLADWQSSKTNIAIVNKGRVQALAPGSVYITAVYGGKYLRITITVK
jgi:hypothetical protein